MPKLRIPLAAELPQPEEIDVEAIVSGYRNGIIDLVCVLGPTASGKTRYAVQLARRIRVDFGNLAKLVNGRRFHRLLGLEML